MAAVKVDVAPSVMIWARESIGLSREEAAKRLKMDEVTLGYLEWGAYDPTFAQVERMAKVYQRPLVAFFLSEPPDDRDGMPDFRLLPGNRKRAWSPEMHVAYRRVRDQRDAALAIAEATGEPPQLLELSLQISDDAEAIAEMIRRWLKAPPPDNFAALTQGRALSLWSRIIEQRAILVTQVEGVPVDEMRGFSLAARPFPIIAVNSSDSLRGRTFTLLHELIHVLLQEDALCDLGQRRVLKGPKAQVERFCDEVAAAVLMPRDDVTTHQLVEGVTTPRTWSDQELKVLATSFAVSEEAMLLRLVTLNKASMDFYMRKHRQFMAIYEERRQRRMQKKASGGPTYYQRKLRNYGQRFVRTAINAYEQQYIDGTDLAHYLDIKLNHLPALVEELDKAA